MLEHDDDLTPASDTARRTVLRGALVLGAAGVLTACGGSSKDNTAAPPAGGDTGGATPPPESTPTPSASTKPKKSAKPKASASATSKPTATTKAGPKPSGTEMGPSSDVKVGGCKIYDKQKVVVTQPTAGKYYAFSAVCTHQECLLVDCEGGKLNCPCHASTFDMTTGVPDSPPAVDPLPKKKVTVAGGKVYVS
jgi:nitrite reductase/ring-hydroxylating ferredoxin subunit